MKTKIQIEEPLFFIEYSFLSTILVLLFRLSGVFLGDFFISVDNIFVTLIGIIFLIVGLWGFLVNIFFIKMIFYNSKIETQWNIFGFKFSKTLLYSLMEVTKLNSTFGGSLMFWDRRSRLKTIYFFIIDLLPVSRVEIKKIKNILVEKKVIQGDEYEWID